MRQFATLLFRAVLVAVCCFATWMSVRHARADLAAASGTTAGIARALRIEPENVELVVSDALLKGDSDDPSPVADAPLLRALRMDPLNSRLLISLGLRAEFRGDNAQAERYLARATEIDHAFTPAWTFANFCVRSGQPDKFWPMARRCLSLDPLLFDPRPVFALAWRETGDSKKIRDILPQTGPRLMDYLDYLMYTNRPEAAAELWPEALGAFDPSVPSNFDEVVAYCDFMSRNNRMSGAVRAWNQLVDRNIIRSGHLDPASGVSIADPDFSFPPAKGLFDWHVTGAEGVYISSGVSALRFELDGNEPEDLVLLSTTAAVLPGRNYRLHWKYDASQLSSPRDPGFQIQILPQPGGGATRGATSAVTICGPLLNTGGDGTCSFTSGADIQRIGIDVRYTRASGTTRVRGTLVISNFQMEFAS